MPGRKTASAASRVSPTEAGNSEVILIRAPTRPALPGPSARCILTCVAVRSVLRVRIIPSATSPHKTIPFWNTAERYHGMFRWRGVCTKDRVRRCGWSRLESSRALHGSARGRSRRFRGCGSTAWCTPSRARVRPAPCDWTLGQE